MSRKEYLWSELTRKNPRLLEDPHFTVASMRKFFERVYDAGWSDGMTNARELAGSSTGGTYTGSDIFSQIFGKR